MSNYPDGMTITHWAYFDADHYSQCENYTHYACRECNNVWSYEFEGHSRTHPANQCSDCGTPCNPITHECVCEELYNQDNWE